MFRPSHGRKAALDRAHVDTIADRADHLAEIAADAVIVNDYEAASTTCLCLDSDRLMRCVLARDVAASAADAPVFVNECLEIEIHVELVPAHGVAQGTPLEVLHRPVAFLVHECTEPIDHVLDDTEPVEHCRGANLNAAGSECDELRRITPGGDPANRRPLDPPRSLRP